MSTSRAWGRRGTHNVLLRIKPSHADLVQSANGNQHHLSRNGRPKLPKRPGTLAALAPKDVVKASHYMRATELAPEDAPIWVDYGRVALDAGRTQ